MIIGPTAMNFFENNRSGPAHGHVRRSGMIVARRRVALALLVALAVVPVVARDDAAVRTDGDAARQNKVAEGTRNFIELHDVYLKWRDGYFGSRSHYRNHLYFLLLDMMGHRIVTGYDYVLLSPELIYERKLKFAFYNGDWLHIEGKVNMESVKKIIGDDSSLLMTWWRSGKLVSVSGVLKGYRIDDWAKKVYVVMDDIQVRTPGIGKK